MTASAYLYLHVVSTEDIPWEVQMDQAAGDGRIGTQWLAKAVHPYNTHTHTTRSRTKNLLPFQENIKGNSKGNDQEVQTGNVGIRISRTRLLSLKVKNSPCFTCESIKIKQIKSKIRHRAIWQLHHCSPDKAVCTSSTLDEFMTGPGAR